MLYNGFFNDYPYKDTSNINLDWLLKKYGAIVNDVNELKRWIATHDVDYHELVKHVSAIESEIDTFEAEVNKEFAKLKTDIEKEVNDLMSEVRKELSDTKAEIEKEFNDAMAEFERVFTDLYNSVQSDIVSMKLEIRRLLDYLNEQIAVINTNVIGYVEDRLNEFIAHLPDYENLIVNNPVTGTQTNVQTAINDLYIHFNIFGITAAQFDSLQLTAAQYDNKELTAYEYDTYAYNILGYPDPNHYMRDPFTGVVSKNKVVIYELADLHKEALTAAEYDALEIDADTFDSMELTAYWFDWYGVSMRDGAIIASDYDSLDLSAADYDSKELAALAYDKFGRTLLMDV